MIEKIKKWIINNNYLIPIITVTSLIILGTIVSFLIYYKIPISMNNKEDLTTIKEMIREQQGNVEVGDIKLKSGIVYTELKDTLYVLSNKLKTEEDIAWYTKVVEYNVILENDTIHCITIFETSEKFLKESVGKHLITINNFRK